MSKSHFDRMYDTPQEVNAFRKRHGLSQMDLAVVLNLRVSTIQKADNVKQVRPIGPTARLIMRMIDCRDVKPESFMIYATNHSKPERDKAQKRQRANRKKLKQREDLDAMLEQNPNLKF